MLLFVAVYTEWRYSLAAGLILLTAALATLTLRFLRPSRHDRLLTCAAIALFSASIAMLMAHGSVDYGYHRKIDRLAGQVGQAEMIVTRPVSVSVYSTACEGRLVTLNGEEVGLEGIFYFPCELSLQTGDRLTAEVTLSPIRGDNADLDDLYSLSKGLFFTAEVSSKGFLITGEQWIFPYSLSATMQDALSSRLRLFLPDEICELANALFLGDKSGLSYETSKHFRHLGLSHTLAVSGLHLGILLGTLSILLKKCRLPRRAHLWIILPIALLYMILVGSPSVMRAGGMLLLLRFALPFGRKRDSLTSLLISVSLICLVSPFSVLDIGLILSFLSTLGILLVGIPLTKHCQALPRLLRWVLTSLILTVSAITFTLPVSIRYFGEVSLISPIANLLLVPLITLLLYLIPLLLLLSPIPLLAATPAYILRSFSKLTISIAGLLGSHDTFMLPLGMTVIETVGLIWLAVCLVLLIFDKTRPIVLLSTAFFLIFASTYVYLHTLEVADTHEIFAYSDGENDALLLRDGTRVMLCDASSGSYKFLADAITYAEQDPTVRVDSLLLTHYHSTMLSTLTYLLERSHIEYLILPAPDSEQIDLATTIALRAAKAGCTLRYYSKEEGLIGYHAYTLLADIDKSGKHPLHSLTVRYNSQTAVSYTVDRVSKWAEDAPLLPANHAAEVPTDPTLWNRRYD